MADEVRIDRRDGVGVLWIDRPPANALELGLIERLERTLEEMASKQEFDALVLVGAGKCFSAGLDLKVVPGYDAERQKQLVAGLNRLFTRLYGLPLPTVAAVNGHALAGGLLLALACDVRLGASDPCQLGLTEVRVGVPYPAAAMLLAQAELGPALARNLVLGGDSFGPDKAVRVGVLDEVLPQEKLLPRAVELAQERGQLSRSVYARTKRQLRGAALREMEAIAHGVR